MDIRLLVEQMNHFALTLMSPRLYSLTEDKSMAYFHDDNSNDLFFIHLNEFLNTSFPSPFNSIIRVSIFELFNNVCEKYSDQNSFSRFLIVAKVIKDFFHQKRYYKYYISPYEIDFEISFAELINFQSNYSKHSFYHLSNLEKKLKSIFQRNRIESFEEEDYIEHLKSFKEFVLDDRLNFNQTLMLEFLGKYFIAYWELINSVDNRRIKEAIHKFISEHGRTAKWNIERPIDMNMVEEFHWQMKGVYTFEKERLSEFIPKTHQYLIERPTSPENKIEKV